MNTVNTVPPAIAAPVTVKSVETTEQWLVRVANEPYGVYDTHTKVYVGKILTHAQRKAVRRRADKLDLTYGACRYVAQFTNPAM